MKRIGVIAFAAVLGVLSACATATGPKQADMDPADWSKITTRTIDRPKAEVFDAFLSYLSTKGFVIKDAQPETGMITTEEKSAQDPNAMSKALTKALTGQRLTASARIQVFVRELDPNRTKAQLVIAGRLQDQYGNMTPLDQEAVYYDKIYTGVGEILGTEIPSGVAAPTEEAS